MRSIEVTFDSATEARIREDWVRLADAGLSSMAAHTSLSNRPHLTLAAGPELEPPSEALPLPGRVTFGSVLLFPHDDRAVLAWGVVMTRELDRLHREVHAGARGALATSLPDQWTPHVTLARRVAAHQLGQAVPLIGQPFTGTAAGIRFWDGDTKTVTELVSSTAGE